MTRVLFVVEDDVGRAYVASPGLLQRDWRVGGAVVGAGMWRVPPPRSKPSLVSRVRYWIRYGDMRGPRNYMPMEVGVQLLRVSELAGIVDECGGNPWPHKYFEAGGVEIRGIDTQFFFVESGLCRKAYEFWVNCVDSEAGVVVATGRQLEKGLWMEWQSLLGVGQAAVHRESGVVVMHRGEG